MAAEANAVFVEGSLLSVFIAPVIRMWHLDSVTIGAGVFTVAEGAEWLLAIHVPFRLPIFTGMASWRAVLVANETLILLMAANANLRIRLRLLRMGLRRPIPRMGHIQTVAGLTKRLFIMTDKASLPIRQGYVAVPLVPAVGVRPGCAFLMALLAL
jgi:hypothetical protein